MQTQMKTVEDLRQRATAAEEELAKVRAENETLISQADVLIKDKMKLGEDLGQAQRRIDQWIIQMKASRKETRKLTKKLELTEERCFQFGYDHAVEKAHDLGWDHKLLLADYIVDPVDREASEGPLEVSSDFNENLLNEFVNLYCCKLSLWA